MSWWPVPPNAEIALEISDKAVEISDKAVKQEVIAMAAAGAYPVRVDASLDPSLSRWLWIFKGKSSQFL